MCVSRSNTSSGGESSSDVRRSASRRVSSSMTAAISGVMPYAPRVPALSEPASAVLRFPRLGPASVIVLPVDRRCADEVALLQVKPAPTSRSASPARAAEEGATRRAPRSSTGGALRSPPSAKVLAQQRAVDGRGGARAAEHGQRKVMPRRTADVAGDMQAADRRLPGIVHLEGAVRCALAAERFEQFHARAPLLGHVEQRAVEHPALQLDALQSAASRLQSNDFLLTDADLVPAQQPALIVRQSGGAIRAKDDVAVPPG